MTMSFKIVTFFLINLNLVFSTQDLQETGFSCSFINKTSCGWEQDTTDNFDWSYDCKYDDCRMYIRTATPNKPNDKARLISPTIVPSGPQCIVFFYHMFGVRVGSLNVYLKTNGQTTLIWHRKHSQDNLWRRGYRTIKIGTEYQIIIEAVASTTVNSTNSDGIIAIDKTEILDGICTPYVQQYEQACDFEENFCMWQQDSEEKWRRATTLDVSLSKKPVSDHTTRTNNGYFAYTGTDQVVTSTSCTLLSEILEATVDERCLQFYYYMQRGTYGKINITVIFDDHEFKLLSSHIGVEDDKWTFAEVGIPGDKPHQILIHGFINNDPNTVIAIDDINIVDDLCEGQDLCSFDYGFCDWRNLIHQPNEIAWLRSSAGEAVVNEPNMPPYDLTLTDRGYFLFVDMTNAHDNTIATLSSKPINSCPLCFVFNIYTEGKDYGALQIIVHTYYGERLLANITEETNRWTEKQIDIDSACANTPCEIYVRAISVKGGGFIAIDGLSITNGKCKPDHNSNPPTLFTDHHLKSTTPKKTPPERPIESTTHLIPFTPILPQNNCKTGTIDCGDGTCILAIYLCDGVKDCSNNADEETCELTCQDTEMNIFCEGFNGPHCIPKSHLCDGHPDCINEADETDLFCGTCPKTYCKTGRCFHGLYSNSVPFCPCNGKEHSGRRCEDIKQEAISDKKAKETDNNMWIMVPMMGLLVVIIAILLVNLYCYRKYKWFHAAGLIGKKNKSLFYQRNSMTEMTTTDVNMEELSDDVGQAEAPLRRGVRDDAISMIHTPLKNYKLHSLYIGSVVLDDDGNIVRISNA